MEKELYLREEENSPSSSQIGFDEQNNSPSSSQITLSSSQKTLSSSEKTISSYGENFQAMSLSEGSEEEDTVKSHQTLSIDNKEEEQTMYSDSDSDLEEDDGTRCMTRRERIEYEKQLFESDGFDVKAIPRVFEIGQIQPCDLNAINGVDEYALECAIAAVDTFNNTRHKNYEGELEFNKLEMATSVPVCGMLFYLTFTAKNAKEGKIITYQSGVVFCGEPKFQVLSFRRKPAAGADKKWFWRINRYGDSCGPDCSPDCSGGPDCSGRADCSGVPDCSGGSDCSDCI